MAKHRIITTVGISIFINFNKKQVNDTFTEARKGKEYDKGVNIDDFENLPAADYDPEIFESLEKKIWSLWCKGIVKEGYSKWKCVNEYSFNSHASAEITSILKIAEKIRERDESAKIEVQLLATDTALSVSAAQLIKKFDFGGEIDVLPFKKEIDFVPSLGVKPQEGQGEETYYETGLQNLVERLIGKNGLIGKAKKDNITPVINFSGGYKSIVPLLTIIAQLEDIPMYYIYEDSDHLMELGSLPVNFDWAVVEALKPILKNYIIKKLNPLARLIHDEHVQFRKDRYSCIDAGKEAFYPELEQIPLIFHRAVYGILSYKLIFLNYENQFEMTPLGKILAKVSLGGERGLVMEHLLFKYFSFQRDGILKKYRATLPPEALPYGFQIL
ncbi:MAG: hypothetical protein KDC75_08670, partial [Phaeodactylibacter sp.]|nr:hypothetical protein [Phaeodactylibacter sp.]